MTERKETVEHEFSLDTMGGARGYYWRRIDTILTACEVPHANRCEIQEFVSGLANKAYELGLRRD